MAYTIVLTILLALVVLQLFFQRRRGRQQDSKPKTDNPANESRATANRPGTTAGSLAAAEAWTSAFHRDGSRLSVLAGNGRADSQHAPVPSASGPLASGIQFYRAGILKVVEDKPAPAATTSGASAPVFVTTPMPDREGRLTLVIDPASPHQLGERFRHDLRTTHVQNFENLMRRRLIGQDEAIEAFCDIVQVAQAGLAMPGKPLANFLFLGPTGSGKTKAMESAADVMTGSELNHIRVDCAEFQHSHEVAKLIGSPPGYLGHRETKATIDNARLTELRNSSGVYNIAIVIFDEIEKASDAVWNLLLGILDKASLTLGNNERVDFSRCIIGMTSNLGAKDLVESVQFGFVKEALSAQKKNDIGMGAARKKFSPEFFNRLDRVITFGTLGPNELRVILGLEMLKVQERVNGVFPFVRIFYTRRMETFLVAEGTDPRYGARPLKRAIQRHVVMPLSGVLSSGQILQRPTSILIDYNETEGQVFFSPITL